MALWVCSGETGCGTKYAIGLSRCPRCHGTEFYEEGSMPKITRNGGPSNASAAPAEGVAAPAASEEAGEQSSPGNSSSTSAVKPQTNTEASAPDRPKPAPTTESRSAKVPKGSTARSTGGRPAS